MENHVQVRAEPGFKKTDNRIFINSLEVGKHYFFEMERVKDIFLGKLIEKPIDENGRVTDLIIEHTYNKHRIPTKTSFDIMFIYQMFEAEENKN